jgi:hypothetical protein
MLLSLIVSEPSSMPLVDAAVSGLGVRRRWFR